jgi:hypothetical protein
VVSGDHGQPSLHGCGELLADQFGVWTRRLDMADDSVDVAQLADLLLGELRIAQNGHLELDILLSRS